MFNWFWEFLYMLSKTIFRLIDGLILCANKLCGIDKISFDGEEKDFLTYLIFSDEIGFAFKISALLATILVFVFTVFMIIRTITKEKSEGTPAQIAVKAFKTLLMFFFVPVVMIAFMTIGNAFVSALYSATMKSAAVPGTFLFNMFAIDGGMNPEIANLFTTGELDYTNTSVVSTYMNLSEFPFLFSWIAGGVVLFGIGSAMLIFVDRVLSLVILYIAAPISMSTSMLDDGARFKLWRDQFLTKFIMGYGMILAINIYAMVCGLVMKPDFVFFTGEETSIQFLNMIMKLLIIAGGALTMQKSMALVGNLVSQGAGSNELRDNALSMGGLARMASSAAGKAFGVATLPFRPLKSIAGDAISMQSRHLGGKLLGALGMDGGKSGGGSDDKKDEKNSNSNNEKTSYGSDPNATKDAIKNDGFKRSFDSSKNDNNKSGQNKNNMLSSVINGTNGQNQQTGGNNK